MKQPKKDLERARIDRREKKRSSNADDDEPYSTRTAPPKRKTPSRDQSAKNELEQISNQSKERANEISRLNRSRSQIKTKLFNEIPFVESKPLSNHKLLQLKVQMFCMNVKKGLFIEWGEAAIQYSIYQLSESDIQKIQMTCNYVALFLKMTAVLS